MESYEFRRGTRQDAQQIFDLIQARMDWMDRQGICQWNTEDYWSIFPRAYYFTAIAEGRLFVLAQKCQNRIVSAGVLAAGDELWEEDGEDAVYLHNFVAALDQKGVGAVFLQKCEEFATSQGKRALRLDCNASNKTLNTYYARQGYVAMGRGGVGNYQGVKWEKRLGR